MDPLLASRPDRSWSLRNRLLLLTILAITSAWLAGGTAVYLAVDDESSELFDSRIAEIAHLIMAYADDEIDIARRAGSGIVPLERASTINGRYRYQIWTDTGELVMHSGNVSAERMAPIGQLGLATVKVADEAMRVYAEKSADGDEVIIVGEPLKFRQTFVGTFHTKYFPWFLATVPLLLLVTWLTFRRATRAVSESAQQIVRRSSTDLRPIEVNSPPQELTPLLKSTNELLVRLENALDAERRLTAAAAHELRTPLAAVKMQAQVAMRARTREELVNALGDLTLCVDRAGRMLDQLLTLAKLEAMNDPLAESCEVSLDAVAAGVLHDLTPLLKKRRLRVTTRLAPARVLGVEFGIAALMRNLIDNAARHSPQGSFVTVETGEDERSTFVMVRDTGPGIPVEEREHVFERFYRLPGTKSEGSGIGLSIVRTVLDLHHADIHLCDAEEGGLCACVRFAKGALPTTLVGTFPIHGDGKIKQFLRHSDDKALPGSRELTHPDPAA
jgi:signal transduction histidine kinase